MLIGAGGLVLSLSPPAHAYSTAYLYPTDDAKTLNTSPDTNYGGTPTNTLGNMTAWAGTDTFHIGYFKFMMSDFAPNLKAYEELQYVQFYFDLYSDFHFWYNDADNYFRLCYSTNQTWVEDAITWNDSPSYTETSEIVEVSGADQYFRWDLTEIDFDVIDAIESENNFTIVILYYHSTQGFNCRFREFGGISYDPRIVIQYNIVTGGVVYEREPSLASFPIRLGEVLHIGIWGGKLLASMIISLMFLLPTAYASKDLKSPEIPLIIIGFLDLALLVAMNYLPAWLLLLVAMIIAMWYASMMKGWFGKGS